MFRKLSGILFGFSWIAQAQQPTEASDTEPESEEGDEMLDTDFLTNLKKHQLPDENRIFDPHFGGDDMLFDPEFEEALDRAKIGPDGKSRNSYEDRWAKTSVSIWADKKIPWAFTQGHGFSKINI